MNHLQPLQRKSDGRWDYTLNSIPWGYCRAYSPIPDGGTIQAAEAIRRENEKMGKLAHKFHTGGHETAEEACECYKQYLLDTSLRLVTTEPEDANTQFRCMVCGVWTACHASVGSYHRLFTLCPAHQAREKVEKLLVVGKSWES